jgi:release factor glutamine methyltransferase
MTDADKAARASLRDLLNDAVATLQQAGVESARLDAELMLARAAGVSRIQVITGDVVLGDAARGAYAALVDRRAAREPLAYILGVKEFYSLELAVTPAVLIPRPETEIAVAAALDFLATRPTARVLDLGTGSGAIALAIAANAPQAMIVATDISDAALAVARQNAERLGLMKRITFRNADCFEVRDGGAPLGRFDLIVSNPPYIVDQEIIGLQPEIVRWEPRLALAGGLDGLDFYRRIADGLPGYLAAEGRLTVELGDGQADAVTRILRAAGFGTIDRLRDPSGIVRVLTIR